ncbi:MAG: hypothetical protein AAGD25_26850 [Cyanobacteria bacterium P01_F01_bin.150]
MLDELLLGLIVLNIAIAIACFWGAWRLVHVRKKVQQWTTFLDTTNSELQQVLPKLLIELRHNCQQLRDRRQQYRQLQIMLGQYIQLTRQILWIVQWAIARWQRSGNLSPRAFEDML